jgi:hypothetical protein
VAYLVIKISYFRITVNCRIDKNAPLKRIMKQLNLTRVVVRSMFKMNFNIVLQSSVCVTGSFPTKFCILII